MSHPELTTGPVAGDQTTDHADRWWRFADHARESVPLVALGGLLIIWAAHDGGYDADTWYWGALVSLATLGASTLGAFGARVRLSRASLLGLGLFAAYAAWSYLSMLWAQYPGAALTGSNRALLYLAIYAVSLTCRWTVARVLWGASIYVLAVAAIGVLILTDMATGRQINALVTEGRLVSPTGYFNADAGLFMMAALLGVALSVRRELPALVRGALLGSATVALTLVVLAESRGWLFTLPVVLVLVAITVRARLATLLAALVPAAAVAAIAHVLLRVYTSFGYPPSQPAITGAARDAGRLGLVAAAIALVVGCLINAVPTGKLPRPRRVTRRLVAVALGVVVVVGAGVAADRVTRGDPGRFISRQWYGFTHPSQATTTGQGSHFTAVGSQRYDFWRAALAAFEAQPITGLGQDNFADYYIDHRRTDVEAEWTHSIEMRLLAHTGVIGAVLFLGFLLIALRGAGVFARRSSSADDVGRIALLALIVWLVHGSVDWFWEMPALSGPALVGLGISAVLHDRERPGAEEPRRTPPARGSVSRGWRALAGTAAVLAFLAAAAVLGFSYLSVREMSIGSDLRSTNPQAALAAFARAGALDPLSSDPGRAGGALALELGLYRDAGQRFAQAVTREPGGWFSWLGAGLAASASGDRETARRDLRHAQYLNTRQPAVGAALARLDGPHPLSPAQALTMLILSR